MIYLASFLTQVLRLALAAKRCSDQLRAFKKAKTRQMYPYEQSIYLHFVSKQAGPRYTKACPELLAQIFKGITAQGPRSGRTSCRYIYKATTQNSTCFPHKYPNVHAVFEILTVALCTCMFSTNRCRPVNQSFVMLFS